MVLVPAPPQTPHTASSGAAGRVRGAGVSRVSHGRVRARGGVRERLRGASRSWRRLGRGAAGEGADRRPGVAVVLAQGGVAAGGVAALVGGEGPVLESGRRARETRPRPRVPLIQSIWAWLPLTVFRRADELAFLVGELRARTA